MRVCVVKSKGLAAPHIMEDIASALEEAGAPTMTLDYSAEGVYSAASLRDIQDCAARLISKITSFKPDFIFSYGCGALIEVPGHGGAATNLFEQLGIPYLLMFYDAPFGGERTFERIGKSPLLRVLCWDKRYLQWFKGYGVDRAIHQPLGVNLKRFASPQPNETLRDKVCFVGTLDWAAVERGLPGNPPLQEIAKRFITLKLAAPCRPFREIFDSVEEALPPEANRAAFRQFRKSPGFAAYLHDTLRMADALYRREAIDRISPYAPCVYGDESWKSASIPNLDFRGAVPYGEGLGRIYASAQVNVNLTGCHLESALNQRVFDCPAAGGFLLTDYREGLEELFDLDAETPCFRSLDELRALLDRYSSDAKARGRIARNARRKVAASHTWLHRMKELSAWLRE